MSAVPCHAVATCYEQLGSQEPACLPYVTLQETCLHVTYGCQLCLAQEGFGRGSLQTDAMGCKIDATDPCTVVLQEVAEVLQLQGNRECDVAGLEVRCCCSILITLKQRFSAQSWSIVAVHTVGASCTGRTQNRMLRV